MIKLFIFGFLVLGQTAGAAEVSSFGGIYKMIEAGQLTQARASIRDVDAAALSAEDASDLRRLRTRLFLEQFGDENALAKNPNAADVFSPNANTKPEKKCYGLVDLAFGDNSNAQTLAGMDSAAPHDQEIQGKLTADCKIVSRPGLDLHLNYQNSSTLFMHHYQTNYIFNDVVLPVAFYRENYRFRLTPEYYSDVYAGDTFSSNYGLTFDVSREVMGSYLSLGLNRTQAKNLSKENSAQTGYQQRVQVAWAKHWEHSSTFTNVYAGNLGYRDTETKKASYNVQGLNAGFRFDRQPYDASFALGGELHTYARAVGDDRARREQKWMVDLQIGYRLAEQTRVYFDFNHTDIHSNLHASAQDNEFRQSQFLLGAVAGF